MVTDLYWSVFDNMEIVCSGEALGTLVPAQDFCNAVTLVPEIKLTIYFRFIAC